MRLGVCRNICVETAPQPSLFSGSLSTHLAALQEILAVEHERLVSGLRVENQRLRERLAATEGVANLRTSAQLEPKSSSLGIRTYSKSQGSNQEMQLTSHVRERSTPRNGGSGADATVQTSMRAMDGELQALQSQTASLKDSIQEATLAATGLTHSLQPFQRPRVHDEEAEEVKLIGKNQHMNPATRMNRAEPAPEEVDARVAKPRYASSTLRALAGDKGDGSNMTCLQRFVFSNRFELASCMLIVVNSLLMCLEMQYHSFDRGSRLGVQFYSLPAEEIWPGAKTALRVFEYFFTFIFAVELLLRLLAMRHTAVRSGWMWFDGILVSVSMIDFGWNLDWLSIDPTLLRLARITRLLRLMRILKTITAFDSLFLLVKSIVASSTALFWSLLLLGLVQVSACMILGQTLVDFMDDPETPLEIRAQVFRRYGSFTKGMLTMLEITLANWMPPCRMLTENVNEAYMIFFVLYRCIFCFAVLKVITAVFIAETNHVMESDDEVQITKKRRAKEVYVSKLRVMFAELDQDGDGHLSWEEFEVVLRDELIRTWLSTLDIDAHDFETLFALLDDGDGNISTEEFLAKVGTIKGAAKSVDMMAQLRLMAQIAEAVDRLTLQLAPTRSHSPMAGAAKPLQ